MSSQGTVAPNKKGKKKQAVAYAMIRIQKRQKAKAGSSGLIDTVKQAPGIDQARYARERKAYGEGSLAALATSQEQYRPSDYEQGHRWARADECPSPVNMRSPEADGYYNALREGTTLAVQTLAARSGQSYKQIWRKRKGLAVSLLVKGKLGLEQLTPPNSLSSEELAQ